jgi:hypothetical protein
MQYLIYAKFGHKHFNLGKSIFSIYAKFGHKHFNLGKSTFLIYAIINLCVEDLDDVEQGESGEDLDGMEEVGKGPAWTQQR